MMQGTGSDVGKSLVVAGLCRVAQRRGLRVTPFKPQNMSNNAAACADGSEIGRAQALQARASGLEPCSDMNPVLLKPQGDRNAQIILHGQVAGTLEPGSRHAVHARLLAAAATSFERLAAGSDLVIVEGAGSPAEVNLRSADLANMGFARHLGVPVCLLGDIDRGGVIAALVGTHAVLDPQDAAMVVGFAVNKLRGDPSLFSPAVATIERCTGWRCMGVIPWLNAAARLPAEDAATLRPGSCGDGPLRVAVPLLPRIANFDDTDPLRAEGCVNLTWVPPCQAIPRDADVVLIPGTKSTRSDLEFLRAQGWHHDILAHARSGGRVVGLCGGFQMLGRRVHDPEGAEGPRGSSDGLGLLDIESTIAGGKVVRRVSGRCALSGIAVQAYEIHAGRTTGAGCEHPMFHLDDGCDGARSEDGRVEGTYFHGLFANDEFRRQWLARVGGRADSQVNYQPVVDAAIDEIADGLVRSLDIEALFSIAQEPGWLGS